MKWDAQRLDEGGDQALPLEVTGRGGVVRGGGRGGLRLPPPVPIEAGTDDEAMAIEITAKTIINRVPGQSGMPFEWTVNPYRGCSHACRYCFARNTHTYLDLDSGRDFDTRIIVKVNAGALLRRELAGPRWRGESIAMGTNTDPYQRAEGRYGLMREIITALRDRANPFSILTKGTLILRDLDLITEAAGQAPVSIAVSVGSVDEPLWRSVEPGTPSPNRRLDVVRRFAERGIDVTVLMAPILPGLSDSPAELARTVSAVVDAGASSVVPVVLHLRPGAREWYHRWLSSDFPELLPQYEQLYRASHYAPKAYQRRITEQVRELAAARGLRRRPRHRAAESESAAGPETAAGQLSLL
ncbi:MULTISPECIES: Rv2578c family radical SAM protein [Actinoalloteichus]|uniref:DNA repair photolyase n=1 Tax=Actinoalloteichus fjordicus TaxID=1612552 RepID=A0AAC9LFH2_9PSEU|nr:MULTISPECIES: Rv2578c family radical SAM protein [Actinoalloteichus]APU15812.1 DNA repair photolyase [Actinoalloteichus fjordicus]APU21872.1 DNA repair photolyase [Actinoalloteichus sp. GBA129-24]